MIEKALRFLTDLKAEAMEPKTVEIAGHVYCDKALTRYDKKHLASAVTAETLTGMVDYIKKCPEELRESMIIHIQSPTRVELKSGLDRDRERESLFVSKADLPEFFYDKYYDQERFMIELQACFVETPDLSAIKQVAGNVEAGTTAGYGDDGVSQKTTIKQGIASKADVIVPNPVRLKPYRTFLEVDQPQSDFVFRISQDDGAPRFKLVEANGGLWKHIAMQDIKKFLEECLKDVEIDSKITIIA